MDRLDFGIPELDTAGTVFRDMLFLMVLGLVVLIFLVSLLIGPPAKHGQTAQHRVRLSSHQHPAPGLSKS